MSSQCPFTTCISLASFCTASPLCFFPGSIMHRDNQRSIDGFPLSKRFFKQKVLVKYFWVWNKSRCEPIAGMKIKIMAVGHDSYICRKRLELMKLSWKEIFHSFVAQYSKTDSHNIFQNYFKLLFLIHSIFWYASKLIVFDLKNH